MNDLKQQLTDKITHLKEGRALIYEHGVGDRKRRYLVMSAENVQEPTLELFMRGCQNLTILTSDDFLAGSGNNSFRTQSEVAVKCDFSTRGLCALLQELSQGGQGGGPDCILLRIQDSSRILAEESAEARLLELMSNVDKADGVLLYGLLLDGEDLPTGLEVMTVTSDEVKLSRFLNPNLLEFTGVTEVDLLQGKFQLYSYYSEIDRRYHWAFVLDDGDDSKAPLVRLESECLTGHVFGSLLCDCGDQLSRGLEEVARYGKGALVYLRQEGRGIGLQAKLEAYYLQQVHGMDTVDANIAVGMPAEARDYLIGAQILNHLGFDSPRLMTNNPAKVEGLARYGVIVAEQVAHVIPPSTHNKRYLETKKTRMGHKI
jgi:GTP cyclohydrolase II